MIIAIKIQPLTEIEFSIAYTHNALRDLKDSKGTIDLGGVF